MKPTLLFIDDQPEIRLATATEFYTHLLGKELEVDSVTTFPHNLDQSYDYISFDNDLGPDEEIWRILWTMYFNGELSRVCPKIRVFVHSMNSIANSKIADLFQSIDVGATVIPFGDMLSWHNSILKNQK